MRTLVGSILVLVAIAVGSVPAAEKGRQANSGGPEKWEPTIARFEADDKAHPPARGGILLVGGSNARRWTEVGSFFPGQTVINRGFGGAKMSEVLFYFDRIVTPYAPKVVLLNAGGNDLSGGARPEDVQQTGKAFVDRVHKALPETRVFYIAIPPTLNASKRPEVLDVIRKTNTLMRDLETGDKKFVFIDIFPKFLDDKGQPRKELFVEDGTHFTHEGQQIVADLIKQKL